MKAITQKNKRVLIIAGICGVVIILFWVFIYFPADKKMRLLKVELNVIKNEISGIESHGGINSHDITKAIDSLQRDFKAAQQRLPGQEEETLKFISSEANKLNIDIVSMQPKSTKPMLDANNNPVFLEGKQCFEMPISIAMKGRYRSIGEYLKILREVNPALIKIEDIRITKDESAIPILRVSLELTLYLLL